MNISTKLFAGFLFVVAATGAQTFYADVNLQRVGDLTTRLYDEPLMATSFARSAQNNFSRASREMSKAIRLSQDFGSAAELGAIDEAFMAFRDDLDVVEERTSSVDAQQAIADIRALSDEWKAQGDLILRASDVNTSTTVTALPMLDSIEAQSEKVDESLRMLIEAVAAEGFAFLEQSEETIASTVTLSTIAGGVVGATGLLIALLLAFQIVRPVKAAAALAESVAEGNLDNEIQTGRRDETGALLRALGAMQENLKEQKAAERRAVEAKAEAEREAERKAAAEREERARTEQERTEAEKQAAEERARRIEEITQGFEASVTEVLQAVAAAAGELDQSSVTMTETAESSSRQSETMANAADMASSNVQRVAAAAEQLSSSINEISRQVSSAAKMAADAMGTAEHTTSAVTGLADSAHNIGNIVELINDIASQTNLLALNATIEASRAGEAGKGFAVVASEVKNLANQTAKATGEISAQIAAMQEQTDGTVTAIKEISDAIDRINQMSASVSAAVEQQGAATQEISRNAQEAAVGTEQVMGVIGDVNKAAANTGATAVEVQGAASSLNDHSRKLDGEIHDFLAKMRAA